MNKKPDYPGLPGDRIRYCGRPAVIGAIGFTGGERYVWLLQDGAVVMVPAAMLAEREKDDG